MKILIVEDDATTRELMLGLLKEYGEPDVVGDGAAAVEALESAYRENKPYDLACLDIVLPRKDGATVLTELRALERGLDIPITSEVKIVMTTIREDPKTVLNAFRDGCEAYITKPIVKSHLKNELEKLGFTPHS